MKTKALFKQVVKFEQFDPPWSILGEVKVVSTVVNLKLCDFGGPENGRV